MNTEIFNWENILHGDSSFAFLFEIIFRTVVMFLFLLAMLKLLSKRGVKQLSVFELAILIALGSATGDPMFYRDVPILYGFVVLIVVILLYKIITAITAKSKKMEILLEGKPVLLLENGRIHYKNYKMIGLPYDKFYGEMRIHSISHLGQVKKVYLETSGDLSIYPFNKKEIVPGLPIFPELLDNPIKQLCIGETYACLYCGDVTTITKMGEHTCMTCEKVEWLVASEEERVV